MTLFHAPGITIFADLLNMPSVESGHTQTLYIYCVTICSSRRNITVTTEALFGIIRSQMGDILVSEVSNRGLTANERPIYNARQERRKMNKVSRIYAITYDAQGWEQRTEIGTATSKGIAYIFAESALTIYKTVRIVYADGTGTLLGIRH